MPILFRSQSADCPMQNHPIRRNQRFEKSKENIFATEDMRCLQQAVQLAKKMGEDLA